VSFLLFSYINLFQFTLFNFYRFYQPLYNSLEFVSVVGLYVG